MGTAIGLLFGVGVVLASSKIQVRPKPRKPRSRIDWALFIDDVASGIRAGLSVPESLWSASERLPDSAALIFAEARVDWQTHGFTHALEYLHSALHDDDVHQLIDVLLVVQETGSSTLASTLSQLARISRERQELFNEVRGRQAVTVNAARVAVAAPWVVLAFTIGRPQTRAAFVTPLGIGVLGGIALVTALSYFAMNRLARIKELSLIS